MGPRFSETSSVQQSALNTQRLIEIPGAKTPWSDLNSLLPPEERYAIQSTEFKGFLFAPKDRLRLSAVLFLCQQHGLKVSVETPLLGCQVVISVRGMTHIETIDPISRYIGVEAGCRLCDLEVKLFEQGQELGISDYVWKNAKSSIGSVIARGACSGLMLQGQTSYSRVLGIEFVRFDGGVIREGSSLLVPSAGPQLHIRHWGGYGEFGIITYVRCEMMRIPESRLRMAWAFEDKRELENHVMELLNCTSTWERFDIVVSGHPNQNSFVLVQISGAFEEMNAFKKICPRISMAMQEDYVNKLRSFFQSQQFQFSKTDIQSMKCIFSGNIPVDNYLWYHVLTQQAFYGAYETR